MNATPSAGPDDRRDPFLWLLIAAALLSRLVWVIWVHPPQEHVFSDMAHYVYRARVLAEHGVELGQRTLAWQAWGTHVLLALPMVLLGPKGGAALEFAALIWAGCSAATVVLSYLLAARSLPARWGPWPARIVGLVALVWIPLLSHTGFFVSETPYTCVLLAATHGAAVMVQDGRGALRAGIFAALAFALRPQSAVVFALLGLAWLVDRTPPSRPPRWSRRVGGRAALIFAAPLVLMLGFSLTRVRVHAGRWGGVAENAAMNLTAGRCHNIVTRAFPDEEALAEAQRHGPGFRGRGRRISLPGFRALSREGPDHPLALRPAFGGETVDFVGYIGDAAIHREIRRRCYARTGVAGQLRYSVTNVALLWVVARPWPESSDRKAAEFLSTAERGRKLAAGLAPLALLGIVLGLWRLARAGPESLEREGDRLGLALCAAQLLSLILVAAVFFGTPRLRAPYDPYALILVAAVVGLAVEALRIRLRSSPRDRDFPSTSA